MPPFLARNVEAPGRPGIDADLAHVRDAAPGASLRETRIAAHEVLDQHELFELDHRSLVRKLLGGDYPRIVQRHLQAHYADPARDEDIGARLAWKSLPRFERAD